MKKIKGFIIAFTLTLGLVSQFSTIFANETGGWSEVKGDFINFEKVNEESTYNYPQPIHKGYRETSGMAARAVGETQWIGQYHYTRAMMTDSILGFESILQDSGRKWGWNYTSAKSPWHTMTEMFKGSAKTYYGN